MFDVQPLSPVDDADDIPRFVSGGKKALTKPAEFNTNKILLFALAKVPDCTP
jgi:hypothetical protein